MKRLRHRHGRSRERIPGTRAIGTRLAQGEENFVDTLMERGGISRAAAERVFDYYRKHKLVKRDFASGVYSVKHGALLDRDVILRAVAGTA